PAVHARGLLERPPDLPVGSRDRVVRLLDGVVERLLEVALLRAARVACAALGGWRVRQGTLGGEYRRGAGRRQLGRPPASHVVYGNLLDRGRGNEVEPHRLRHEIKPCGNERSIIILVYSGTRARMLAP